MNIGIEEATRFYLERIEKYDHKLNIISEINELALKQARELDSTKSERDSILFGLPLLIKDNIDVTGLHTTAGSLALSDNLAKTNATVVENMNYAFCGITIACIEIVYGGRWSSKGNHYLWRR